MLCEKYRELLLYVVFGGLTTLVSFCFLLDLRRRLSYSLYGVDGAVVDRLRYVRLCHEPEMGV